MAVEIEAMKPAARLGGRRARGRKTIEVMMRMYCSGNAHRRAPHASLCPECKSLLAYAIRRLERCVFGDRKPNCDACTVHCYRADMRDRIRAVMRWAGPRLMLRHPILALRHMIDGLRPAPALARPPAPERDVVE